MCRRQACWRQAAWGQTCELDPPRSAETRYSTINLHVVPPTNGPRKSCSNATGFDFFESGALRSSGRENFDSVSFPQQIYAHDIKMATVAEVPKVRDRRLFTRCTWPSPTRTGARAWIRIFPSSSPFLTLISLIRYCRILLRR